ncbi:tektin-4 [Anthonomus grandis grandis]|uniref:tektin-4 n=1 Tax=Anthonomus grandis grandis TaxID=2921223 RepID=UPI0021654EC3|nr:tektin-4 [Anthonomus grandis grandis]
MAEYPSRCCGPCPYIAQFGSNPSKPSDYLTQNTVPEPNVDFKETLPSPNAQLGVSKAYQTPDLTKSALKQEGRVDYDFQAQNRKYDTRESIVRHNLGGMPPCAEANMRQCCLNKDENNTREKGENKVQIDCEVFNREGTIKPLKGILKGSKENPCFCPNATALPVNDHSYPSTPVNLEHNKDTKPSSSLLPQYSSSPAETTNRASYQPLSEQSGIKMHATAGRQNMLHPENPEIGAKVPVPNELRPVPPAERPVCYLPQPEDAIVVQNSNEMGPVGPWATGKADWGPLGGLTGTRPVVDKYSITRYSEGEWRSHNKTVLDDTNTEQHRANLIDWNGRQCLEQTQSDVDKNQEDNTRRLNQREMEIMRWKCELERAIAAAAEEIALMEEQRRRLKQAASVLQMPESIAGECLDRRTGRLDSELVRDEVEEELIKEVALCSEIRDIFSRTLKDVELQLLEDRTAKQRLEYDWSDKSDAHQIDALNSSLNTRSTVLLFKPGAVIFPENQSTPEYWEHFTKETLLGGEATRQRSVTLRGTLDAILMNASRDLRSQADRVELALAKKVACTEEVVRRMEIELKQILRQLADVEDLVNALKAAIRRMDIPMKKAQTRLDNRLMRPRVENCRDAPHFGLIDEVKSISENVAALQAQLGQAKKSQENMINIRNTLEREIMLKMKTLEIDRDRVRRIRSHYPSSNALSGH